MSFSLTQKLGFDQPGTVLLINSPEQFSQMLTAEGISYDISATGVYRKVIFFVLSRQEAEHLAAGAVHALAADGWLWLAYPKGTSKRYKVDINRDRAWDILKPYDYEPVSQVAIDEDWTAMRFRPQAAIKRKSRN
ncbi:MAG: hypothetical protein ACM3NT_01140 [Methylocystaceae bacterium]